MSLNYQYLGHSGFEIYSQHSFNVLAWMTLQGCQNMVRQKDSPVSFNFLQIYVIAILINLRLPLVICVWGKLLISEIFHTDTLHVTNVKEVLHTEIGWYILIWGYIKRRKVDVYSQMTSIMASCAACVAS